MGTGENNLICRDFASHAAKEETCHVIDASGQKT
jgi:hypothetical protein